MPQSRKSDVSPWVRYAILNLAMGTNGIATPFRQHTNSSLNHLGMHAQLRAAAYNTFYTHPPHGLETNVRSLLGVSTEHYCHHKSCFTEGEVRE